VTITASYGGNNNFKPSQGTQLHTVNKAETTLQLTGLYPTPAVVGQPTYVSYSASTAAPGYVWPSGSVTVTVSGDSAYCVGGFYRTIGGCQLTPTSAGVHTFTATYEGNHNLFGSRATAVYAVEKATTTITITTDLPDPSAVGQPISVTFSVTGNTSGVVTPTGSVTVTANGGVAPCVGALTQGRGICIMTPIATDVYTLTATYGGDNNFHASVGTELHSVSFFQHFLPVVNKP
jgi:hypothetical protein